MIQSLTNERRSSKKFQAILQLFISLILVLLIQNGLSTSVLAQHSEPVSLSPTGSNEVWQRDYWSNQEIYSIESSPRSEYDMLVLQSDTSSYARFHKQVPLQPKSEYRLSFWIKTENISGVNQEAGAGVRLGGFDFTPDVVFTGTNHWTQHEISFSTWADDSMVLEFLLGKNGEARGTVWIDEVVLQQVSSRPIQPSVIIDLGKTREKMSDYIYGQFIEHMGNSIYGGIWAEMLEDRKFFFKPNSPNSPWKIVGSPSTIRIDSSDAYVGKYSPVLISEVDNAQDTGLFQTNLWLEQGREYAGRIILSGDASVGPVDIILEWGEESDQRDVVRIDDIGSVYQSFPLHFKAGKDTRQGTIQIIPRGSGSLRMGTLSLMPADNIDGFRPDVLALMKELDSPVYRWPGGNFVSGYDWKDGVGERDKRPPRTDRAWLNDYAERGEPWNAIESNDVGIHEFMKLCKLLDTEPYVAINTGLGTVEMAANEVEYLNGSENTSMGKRRAENGHPEPFDVEFFAVGNEMYGDWQLGHMPVEEYVEKHNRTAKAIWDVDPDAVLVAVGSSGEWNEQMYTHSVEYMDYISEHFYRQDWHGGGLMTHVMQIPKAIKEKADEHRRWRDEIGALQELDIDIVLDEWNFWYGPHVYGLLGTRYFLRDALGIAAGLNEFSRNSDIFFMANYAQTVNVIGAIKATPTEAFMAATGVVLKTYRKEFGTIPVEITGEMLPFDVAATLTEDGKYVTISVINPTTEDHELELDITGGDIDTNGEHIFITGNNSMVYNEPGREEVKAQTLPVRVENGTLTVPAISASIYKFPVQE